MGEKLPVWICPQTIADKPTIVPDTKKRGTHGYAGVRNGLGASAIFLRSAKTAPTANMSAAHSTTTK